jgi:hypothetical protein
MEMKIDLTQIIGILTVLGTWPIANLAVLLIAVVAVVLILCLVPKR